MGSRPVFFVDKPGRKYTRIPGFSALSEINLQKLCSVTIFKK